MKIVRLFIACTAIFYSVQNANAQATITESMVKFKTYPYSDPDPVARITKH